MKHWHEMHGQDVRSMQMQQAEEHKMMVDTCLQKTLAVGEGGICCSADHMGCVLQRTPHPVTSRAYLNEILALTILQCAPHTQQAIAHSWLHHGSHQCIQGMVLT